MGCLSIKYFGGTFELGLCEYNETFLYVSYKHKIKS